MADKGTIYMVRSIGPRTEHRGTPECTGVKVIKSGSNSLINIVFINCSDDVLFVVEVTFILLSYSIYFFFRLQEI